MPRSKKSKPARRRRSRQSAPLDVVWRGRIPNQISNSGGETYVRRCSLITDVSSSGGIINAVINMDPASLDLWSSMTAVFKEYRVLACGFEWVPYLPVSPSIEQKMVVVLDRTSATALASYGAAADYQSAQILQTAQLMQYGNKAAKPPIEYRAMAPDEYNFLPCSSTTIKASLKFYAANLTTAVVYGTVFSRFVIQFRNAW